MGESGAGAWPGWYAACVIASAEKIPGTQRVSQLLAPYSGTPLAAELSEQIFIYLNIMIKWNRRINLTAIREPEEIVRRHFGESLFAARALLSPEGPAREAPDLALSGRESVASVIDVGSGAGFPGMVLKLYAPGVRLTLIESQGKKATFLRELTRSLGLRDVSVVQERAERFSSTSAGATTALAGHPGGRAVVVTLRAVEKFADVLPVAASLVLPGGRLGALIGSGQLGLAAKILPGSWRSLPMPQSASRVLAIWTSP
jgi:16S rRNA (guanine527-N7)-methyltransferase